MKLKSLIVESNKSQELLKEIELDIKSFKPDGNRPYIEVYNK